MLWSNQANEPQPLSLCSKAWGLQLLTLSAATAEASEPDEYALQQKKPPQQEASVPQLEKSVCWLHLKKRSRGNEDPAQSKMHNL